MKTFFYDIETHILAYLDKAEHSIFVAAAWFTNHKLMQKLLEKQQTGLMVEIITSDKSDLSKLYNSLREFVSYGGAIYQASEGSNLMHHKFCIIDNALLINGSFNWTQQAKRNDENIIVMESEEMALQFLEQFIQLKSKCESLFEDTNNPQISFFPNKPIVSVGEDVEIFWQVRNATELFINDEAQTNFYHFQKIKLLTTSNFSLRAINEYGVEKIKNIQVKVALAPTLEYKIYCQNELILASTKDRDSVISVIENLPIHIVYEAENAEYIAIGTQHFDVKSGVLISFKETTNYRILAVGLQQIVSYNIHIQVIKIPQLEKLVLPFPDKINIHAEINFRNLPDFSNLYLDISDFPLPAMSSLENLITETNNNFSEIPEGQSFEQNEATFLKNLDNQIINLHKNLDISILEQDILNQKPNDKL